VGADQGQTAANLFALPPLERRQERRGLGRFTERRAVTDLDLRARAGQRRVHARELGL
jgi:hypothetical protein